MTGQYHNAVELGTHTESSGDAARPERLADKLETRRPHKTGRVGGVPNGLSELGKEPSDWGNKRAARIGIVTTHVGAGPASLPLVKWRQLETHSGKDDFHSSDSMH